MQEDVKITVGIPCCNEEATIGKVIGDFRENFPKALILVVDNSSNDKTAQIASDHGAVVLSEKRQGKGFAVRKIFDVFMGDILVLVDGDDTYAARDSIGLVEVVKNGDADMAVGNRIHPDNSRLFCKKHWLGNKFLTSSLNFLFRTKLHDIESGLRAIDAKFVKSSALLAGGFGIEPEITIQALEKGCRIKELPISIRPRQEGSASKLSAFRDGTIVLYTIISLFRDYKPLQFFSLLAGYFAIVSLALGWYSIPDYFQTGIVYHIPALVVGGFFAIAAFVSFIAGLILSSIKRRHDELLVIIGRNGK